MPKFRFVVKEPDSSFPIPGWRDPAACALPALPRHPLHEAYMHSIGGKTFAERCVKEEVADARS